VSLPHAEVYVCQTQALDVNRVSAALSLLSEDERQRQHCFGFPEDRRDYVAAHVLARLAIAARTGSALDGLQFGATAHGKPFLIPASPGERVPSFNITHTRGLVACVVAGGSAGVDAERVDRSIRGVEIAQRWFSRDEGEALERCAGDVRAMRFYELWTLKEAFAKARGVGLAGSLKNPSFALGEDGLSARGERAWSFFLVDTGLAFRVGVALRPRAELSAYGVEPFALANGLLETLPMRCQSIRLDSRPPELAARRF